LLFLSNLTFAQENCSQGILAPVDVGNQDILFVVSTDTEQQIWRYDFFESASVDTGIKIPGDSFQLILSPHSNQLAYGLTDFHTTDLDSPTNRIMVVDLKTGNDVEVFSGGSPNYPQIIDLHWIEDGLLGFVSNAREQQYTIVDIENGSSETYQSKIPIPQQETIGESIRGDWHIEYSPDFSRAAFMDFRDYENNITFWNLDSGQLIESDAELPVGWVAVNRAFKWINADHFLIRNEELNWLVFSLQNNTIQRITDVGETYRLQAPIVAPNTASIAFVVQDADLNSFNTSIAVWRDSELIESCLNEDSGQYLMTPTGWDDHSRYFAFTVYDYEDTQTHVYVFDAETARLSSIYLVDKADPKAVVIGWIEVN
jgi:hypothetical protein